MRSSSLSARLSSLLSPFPYPLRPCPLSLGSVATKAFSFASYSTNTTPPALIPQQSTTPDKMASDEDYAAFLDKANQDPSEGMGNQPQAKTASNGKLEFKATDSGAKIPPVLDQLQAYYVSDADEEFVPVCLKMSGEGLPDECKFLA